MDEKNIVLQKINNLNKLYLETLSEQILFDMELILINYLHHYPKDSEMWLKLVMVEFTPPLEDYDRIENYIKMILEYDENNVYSLLILAYAQYIFRGQVQDDLFIRLNNLHGITDKELLSMIYLAKAWYYEEKDEKKYEQLLLKSIYYCNKYVENYLLLGRLYFKIGKKVEGKEIIQLALKNIQKIYNDDNSFNDITDINPFFDEFFKGICITPENLRAIQRLID